MRENEQECAWPYRAKISLVGRYYQIENNNDYYMQYIWSQEYIVIIQSNSTLTILYAGMNG